MSLPRADDTLNFASALIRAPNSGVAMLMALTLLIGCLVLIYVLVADLQNTKRLEQEWAMKEEQFYRQQLEKAFKHSQENLNHSADIRKVFIEQMHLMQQEMANINEQMAILVGYVDTVDIRDATERQNTLLNVLDKRLESIESQIMPKVPYAGKTGR